MRVKSIIKCGFIGILISLHAMAMENFDGNKLFEVMRYLSASIERLRQEIDSPYAITTFGLGENGRIFSTLHDELRDLKELADNNGLSRWVVEINALQQVLNQRLGCGKPKIRSHPLESCLERDCKAEEDFLVKKRRK